VVERASTVQVTVRASFSPRSQRDLYELATARSNDLSRSNHPYVKSCQAPSTLAYVVRPLWSRNRGELQTRSGLTRVHLTLDGSARSIDGQPPFSAGSCSGYWVNRQELAESRCGRALWANVLSRRRRSALTETRPTGSPTKRFRRPPFDIPAASPRAGISGWGTTRWPGQRRDAPLCVRAPKAATDCMSRAARGRSTSARTGRGTPLPRDLHVLEQT
jgi:hypothetical protein